jgi:hypothetical protein
MRLSRTLELLAKARESDYGIVFIGATTVREGERCRRAYNSLVDADGHMKGF